MSKTALKKELSSLSNRQLIEVILNAYSSNKSVKDYFDFFSDPDVDKLYERHIRILYKEITRSKYHNSTARISRIKKTIKDFESYNPGAEHVRDLRLWTINALIEQKKHVEYSETLINGTLRLINDTINYADSNLIFDTTIAAIDNILKEPADRTKHLIAYLRDNLTLPDRHS